MFVRCLGSDKKICKSTNIILKKNAGVWAKVFSCRELRLPNQGFSTPKSTACSVGLPSDFLNRLVLPCSPCWPTVPESWAGTRFPLHVFGPVSFKMGLSKHDSNAKPLMSINKLRKLWKLQKIIGSLGLQCYSFIVQCSKVTSHR